MSVISDLQSSEVTERSCAFTAGLDAWCNEKIGREEHANRLIAMQRMIALYNKPTAHYPLPRLNLSRLNLSSLPRDIGRIQNLAVLDLEGNQLDSLPEEITNLKSLECVNLAKNSLSSLPPEICRISSLKTLIIDDNRLSSLPDQLFALPNLKEIHLNNCRVSRVGIKQICNTALTSPNPRLEIYHRDIQMRLEKDENNVTRIVCSKRKNIKILRDPTFPSTITIQANSSPEFVEYVRRAFMQILATEYGRELISEIGKTGYPICFRYNRHNTGEAIPDDCIKAGNGIGCGSMIEFSMDPVKVFDENMNLIECPPDVLIVHELGHALHNACGNSYEGGADQIGCVEFREFLHQNGISLSAWHNVEEYVTILACENRYREQRDLPMRFGHGGDCL